jgi:hypothetical protein
MLLCEFIYPEYIHIKYTYTYVVYRYTSLFAEQSIYTQVSAMYLVPGTWYAR